MEMTKTTLGVWILFKLKGRLDANSAPELDKELESEIENRLDIVLDFSELDYISSMGLRSIMQAAKKTYEVRHRVAICGMKGMVKDTLESSGMTGLVDVYDDLSKLPFAYDVPIKHD
ncbi:MAG: STAS domain-containing protein [Selenomonadaceae bacterium]|nr:STAS domain-containing protein [Selenomonadaceae bacterium]